MKFEKLTDCLKTLNLFANDTRLKILCIIGNGRMTGVEILKELNIAQPSLSYHLSQMVKAGILNAEDVWKWTYYSINGDNLKEAVKSLKIITEVVK
jgi:DNA-binding transcriptional ArsR family regulator